MRKMPPTMHAIQCSLNFWIGKRIYSFLLGFVWCVTLWCFDFIYWICKLCMKYFAYMGFEPPFQSYTHTHTFPYQIRQTDKLSNWWCLHIIFSTAYLSYKYVWYDFSVWTLSGNKNSVGIVKSSPFYYRFNEKSSQFLCQIFSSSRLAVVVATGKVEHFGCKWWWELPMVAHLFLYY